MNKIDLGWVAGIVDGEGSIVLMPGYRAPRVTVVSTDIEILKTLKILVGGYIYPRKDKRKHTFQAWMWVVNSRFALDLLKEIAPYLRVPMKRARAECLLKNWKPRMKHDVRDLVTYEFFSIQDKRHKRSENIPVD